MIISPFTAEHAAMFSCVQSQGIRIHFSQLGEDCILWQLFGNKKNGFYGDIGCHHPFRFSNTALLHVFNERRGINVDADEQAVDLFRQHRPGDINICSAVGPSSGQSQLHILPKHPACKTLDPAVAERYTGRFGDYSCKTVDVVPLSDILRQHMPANSPIDLLTIDVEGLDYEVLTSNDWTTYMPTVVCIETHGLSLHNPLSNRIASFLLGQNYNFVSHVVATSIFKRKD